MRSAKYVLVAGLYGFCEMVDRIPAFDIEEKRWVARGDWGHRADWFRPSDWSGDLDEKWGLNYWKPAKVEENERSSN